MVATRAVRGFTLIEMLVAVSILALLTTIAVPNMRALIAGQAVKTAASDLYSALTRARSEAIKRNADATLAPAGAWAAGWTVAAGGVAVDTHSAVNADVSIAGPASIVYRGLGRPSATGLQLSVTSTAVSTARCVQLSLTGQPVVLQSACS